MKKLIVAAALAVGLALTPVAAYADEPLPSATYVEPAAPVLNCVDGTWTTDWITYTAVQTEPGVFEPWVETSRESEISLVDVVDCPNWVETFDENGWLTGWVNSDLPIVVEEPVVVEEPSPVDEATEEVADVEGEGVDWDEVLPRNGAAGRYWPEG